MAEIGYLTYTEKESDTKLCEYHTPTKFIRQFYGNNWTGFTITLLT